MNPDLGIIGNALVRVYEDANGRLCREFLEQKHEGKNLFPVLLGEVSVNWRSNAGKMYRLSRPDRNSVYIGKGKVTLWLTQNCQSHFKLFKEAAWFESESDAVAFKMWIDGQGIAVFDEF